MNTKLALKLNIQHFATQTFPEPNLQTVATLDKFKEKSIDFTYQFTQDFQRFSDALGQIRMMPVANGMTIELFGKPEVTLADGNVPEGELVPLSKVVPTVATTKKLTLKKYRKSTSFEAMQTYGVGPAIDITDRAMVEEVQEVIFDDLFTFVQSGQSTANLNITNGLQGALATAYGALKTVFGKKISKPVVFANPMDVAQAIADKTVTVENRFGLDYLVDISGTLVIETNEVEAGSIYATASQNIVMAYIPLGSNEAGAEFGLTADESGLIGMKHFTVDEAVTYDTLLLSGVLIFPERLDGVIKVPIAETPTV